MFNVEFIYTMPDMAFRFRRNLKYVHRRLREWRMLWKGLASTDHPVLAHIIPMRRCNLACAYCNEYDDFSKPVPLDYHAPAPRLAWRSSAPPSSR